MLKTRLTRMRSIFSRRGLIRERIQAVKKAMEGSVKV